MKICQNCKHEFENETWHCSWCAWMPDLIQSFPAFSPELAIENDGLSSDSHHLLDQFQEHSFWFRARNRIIKDVIRHYFSHSTKVLEIGCGSGFVLSAIREVLPTAHLTATEIFSYPLHYANKRVAQPADFLQMDARNIPFKNEFDLIGAFDVLEHITEDDVVIKNMFNSLKPGGGIILTVPQHPWLWSKVDEISHHKRRYSSQQLSSLLREQGFTILMNTSFMFFLLPMMLLQRKLNNKSHHDTKKILGLPKLIDKTFEFILEIERQLIRRKVRFPIGGSRLVVAIR